MGYGYYFLLAIRSLPKSLERTEEAIETYLRDVVAKMMLLVDSMEQTPYFIKEIGARQHGPASKYSCGGAKEEIEPAMKLISSTFPEIIFDLYHVAWDFHTMEIYTFFNGKLVEQSKLDFENLEVHTGIIVTEFPFDYTMVPYNISEFFNEDYPYTFAYDDTLFEKL